MAAIHYGPVEQGRLLANHALASLAKRLGVTLAQVALAWVMRLDGVIVNPKAGTAAHVRENRAAADLQLSSVDLDELDAVFPRSRGRRPPEML